MKFGCSRSQRGTSTLEFILVLPTLLIVLFGIVEMSRAWLTLGLVTTAAREAARMGAVVPPDQVDSTARARIDEVLTPGSWDGTVVCDPAPCAPDSEVKVTVSVVFTTLVPLLQPMIPDSGTFTIMHTASVRYE